MPDLSARIDVSKIDRMYEKLDIAARSAVVGRVISRTNTTMKKVARQEVAKELALNASVINESLRTSSFRTGRGEARLEVFAQQIPVFRFRNVRSRHPKGVTVKIRKKRRPVKFRHAFVATMPNGHIGVFNRNPKAKQKRGPSPNRSGLPIREVFSQGPFGILSEKAVGRRILDAGSKRFITEYRREVIRKVATR